MDDVTRLFELLVEVLAAEAPERLRRPFQVSELYQDILPYRAVRRRLGIDSIEDYDMAVLRLLTGHGEFARVDPPEVREALTAEVDAVNPDPGAFREYAAATVTLDPREVRRVLQRDEAYAPPDPTRPSETDEAEEGEAWDGVSGGPDIGTATDVPRRTPVFQPVDREPPESREGSACPFCGEPLPTHRAVRFCPFCGREVGPLRCARCGETVEPGWAFCVSCGDPVEG